MTRTNCFQLSPWHFYAAPPRTIKDKYIKREHRCLLRRMLTMVYDPIEIRAKRKQFPTTTAGTKTSGPTATLDILYNVISVLRVVSDVWAVCTLSALFQSNQQCKQQLLTPKINLLHNAQRWLLRSVNCDVNKRREAARCHYIKNLLQFHPKFLKVGEHWSKEKLLLGKGHFPFC